MNEHHRKRIDDMARRFGVSGLSELFYRVQRGDNFHALKRIYAVELYELRYLQICASFVHCYIYEKEHSTELRLIWSRVA